MDLPRKRVQIFFFIVGIIALSMTAEKCREIVGKEGASKSGQFTILNCLDMGSGSLSCAVKEGVKLYVYNIRASYVERVRLRAIEAALNEALSGGLSSTLSAKEAQKAGAKAAKLASRKARRIMGPIISSGWDFFEALYFGGTLTEGFLRGTGTLFGAYGGGFLGEIRLGRFGYLVGSFLGSWVGGRIGLMVYDVVNGVHYLLQSTEAGEEDANSGYVDSAGNEEQANVDTTSEYEYVKPEYEATQFRQANEKSVSEESEASLDSYVEN